MNRLGPWGRGGRVAVAVSGGADSLCLAYLAKGWGEPVALIVDHRLRPNSGRESEETHQRLAALGIPAYVLPLSGLRPGSAVAARARQARYEALTRAARALGLSDLLLGHHAGDQAETVLLRQEWSSGPAGLAAMPAIAVRDQLRLVRPLLGIPPARLRATLRAARVEWNEDPSNGDLAWPRNRLRAQLADPSGTGPLVAGLNRGARLAAVARAEADSRIARTLAARAALFPEGYALLSPGPIAPECLAALIRMIGGKIHPPAAAALARLAASPRPATLGGVRLMQAARLGGGILLAREPAAIGPDVPAVDGATWDGRFRLDMVDAIPEDARIGALARRAAQFRRLSSLPGAVLQSLPVIQRGGQICAIPHLDYFTGWTNSCLRLTLTPPEPACGAPWMGDAEAARCHHVLV